MTTRLQQALETLYGLERKASKLGLEGTTQLLAALGNPHHRFRTVHVAGTNGKGTVCALIERVLRAAGYRTGLFTSPHLVDFRERIRVDGRWADESWLEERVTHIQGLTEGRDRTFFEVATVLAFDYFAARRIEWGVVEVGLGGRLDCTNVITPDVTVITSIGLDHTEILGDTIEQIAAEKAGIIKPGIPIVTGALIPEARSVIEQVAAERQAPLVRGEGTYGVNNGSVMKLLNAGVALAALRVLSNGGLSIPHPAVEEGLALARWPGRLERCPTLSRLWWDGAHNGDGASAVAEMWRGEPFGTLVLGVSRDKDVGGMLGNLGRIVTPKRLVATRSHSERAADPKDIAAIAISMGWQAADEPGVAGACRRALEWAPASSPVLLTGSLFVVGEAMEAFGGAPGEQL